MKPPIEVRIPHTFDPTMGHDVIDWLKSRSIRPVRHYDINMYGGTKSYTSFFFHSKRIAIMVALHWT